MTNLDTFTRAYITAALWSTNDESDESGGYPLDQNYDESDLSPETLAGIVDDCAKFQRDNSADIAAAGELGDYANQAEWSPDERAGHDFWLTRNHHGAGFWDRGLGDVGDRLTAAAHAYGEVNLYVGDDGRIWA